MLLFLTISVENLMGYNDIVRQFDLCILTQLIRQQKGSRANKLVYICLLFVQDENKDMLMQ